MQPSIELFARQIAMIERIIWTLTFAAQLVLLVVLVGRDRARRYPWFTAGIALLTLRMMAEVLLSGRMAKLPLQEFLFTLRDLAVIAGLLVLVEMARSAFAGIQRSVWIVNTVGLLLVAGGLLFFFEPWPVWKQLPWGTPVITLYLMQLAAQKGDVLVALLTVGLGVLVVIFGRHYKAGWRSHTQQIVIGLFAVAVTHLALETVILRTLHYTQAQSESVMRLRLSFAFAHELMYLAALVWWISWLWRDEPGAATVAATEEKE
ncbi:MAG TPA: hypothetical protein VKF63_10780 [Terracidiphilus sp.]|nr:hypothetical protein [Terracidiphilus sp.]